MGGALGIAVLGSVLNGTYRNDLELPAGVPAEAADQIRESLGGALEIAATLPGKGWGRPSPRAPGRRSSTACSCP